MINVKQWMDLPQKVRDQIAKDLNLERTGRRGISNNIILSDGHTQDDILKINTPNLQALLDSTEEDFDTLFKDYVSLIEGLEVEPEYTEIIIKEDNTVTMIPETVNLNVAPSGDTETYFGTKVKPVSYQPKTETKNAKKTKGK